MRSTNDIDVIVVLDGDAAEALPRVFPDAEFYCPPQDVIDIERNRERRGHFNLIHHDTGWKADVYSAPMISCMRGHCRTGALSKIKVCKFGWCRRNT